MFGKIADFLSGSFLGKATNLIDELVTSKEEKAALQLEMEKAVMEHQHQMMEFVEKENAELTARHKADMASDSWLSKNIRPLTLIVIISLYSIFAILDGNVGEFNISDSYVGLLGQWGMLIMSFYFGGRTVEKVGGAITSRKLFKK